MTTEEFKAISKSRILVLDGAMGTMIQRYGLQEEDYRGEKFSNHPYPLKGNNDLLSITQPQIIKEIHTAYLDAGADIIETNTFNSTSIAQADYHLEDEVYNLNFYSAKIAKEVAEEFSKKTPQKPRFVAGSMGPTNRSASMSPDVNDPGYRAITFDELVEAYTLQANALLDGGVDILLVETVFDTLNCKAAMYAINTIKEKRNIDVPVMVSGTITDASGRTLSGQSTEAFLISLEHANLAAIGLNCALGAAEMRPYVKILSEKANIPVSAHPNAGLPNEFGAYDETAEQMGVHIEDFIRSGFINIIGGCCGTTPTHIKTIANLAQKYKARKF